MKYIPDPYISEYFQLKKIGAKGLEVLSKKVWFVIFGTTVRKI